jgi:hypothetical protein
LRNMLIFIRNVPLSKIITATFAHTPLRLALK